MSHFQTGINNSLNFHPYVLQPLNLGTCTIALKFFLFFTLGPSIVLRLLPKFPQLMARALRVHKSGPGSI